MFEIVFKDSNNSILNSNNNTLVITVFQHLTNAIFVVSIILLLVYGKIIVHCMGKEMKIFKFLSLCYISCLGIMEICLVTWKPILLPHKIIYPIGLLSPMGSKASFFFLVGTIFVMSLTLEVLLVTLFERYVTIFAFSKSKLSFSKSYGYGIVYTIYIGFIIAALALCWTILPTENDMRFSLSPFVENSDILFMKTLNFVIVPTFGVHFLIVLFLIGIYAFTRIIAGGYLIYANFKSFTTLKTTWSQKTQKHLHLMFRTTVIQICSMFLFGFTPAFIWLLSTLTFSSGQNDILFLACFILTMSYPIFDAIIVISVVKPYREAVNKFVKMDFSSSFKVSDANKSNNSKAIFTKTVTIF